MSEKLHNKRDKYRLEGALGYVLRIAQKIEEKASIEEINTMVQTDFELISASLSRHLKEDLLLAGLEVGLFDDSLKERTASNQENKN